MAEKIFVDDDVLLTLNTGKVLTAFTDFRIKFKRPDGTKGYWTATIYQTTKIRNTVNFDTCGIWQVQAFVSDVNSKFHGMFCDIKVYPAIAPDTTLAPTTAPP